MTNKTNTPKETLAAEMVVAPGSNLTKDLKTAVLIVSLVANLYVFTTWVALQVTAQYDSQLASFLFTR